MQKKKKKGKKENHHLSSHLCRKLVKKKGLFLSCNVETSCGLTARPVCNNDVGLIRFRFLRVNTVRIKKIC